MLCCLDRTQQMHRLSPHQLALQEQPLAVSWAEAALSGSACCAGGAMANPGRVTVETCRRTAVTRMAATACLTLTLACTGRTNDEDKL